MILRVVFCGCETWSLTLKEGHRWKVFGCLLTDIFEPKKEEGPGGFETLRNTALRNLCLHINYWHGKKLGLQHV
jgi:hypothetical protein